jgi:hypothetical protein
MAIYVVMEPPGPAGKIGATVFVRDGFSWLAFFFPPLWLLWHRLWIEALLAFAALGLISAAGEYWDLGLAGALLGLLASFYFGLEGQALRIAALRRRGWREWGVVGGDSVDDADARYLEEADAAPEERLAAPRIVPDARRARPAETGVALGLAHVPGRT